MRISRSLAWKDEVGSLLTVVFHIGWAIPRLFVIIAMSLTNHFCKAARFSSSFEGTNMTDNSNIHFASDIRIQHVTECKF